MRNALLTLTFLASSLAHAGAPVLLEERALDLDGLKATYAQLETVSPRALPEGFAPTHRTELQVILLEGNAWTRGRVWERVSRTAAVYLQCGVHLDRVKLYGAAPRGFDAAGTDMNVITDPFGNDQVTNIGRALSTAGMLGPATLIYVQEQTKTLGGVSFPRVTGGRFRNRPVPFRDEDLAIIPHIYETARDLVPVYASADYLGEAHELGHLFSLMHTNRSPLMYVDPLGETHQQNNQLYGSACFTVKNSHLVHPL